MIVTNVGRDAVDAAALGANEIAGRVSRERSTGAQTNGAKSPAKPFGEDGLLRTAKACGSGTRCWCQAVGGGCGPTGSCQPQAGSDGDKTNSSPGRARHKP